MLDRYRLGGRIPAGSIAAGMFVSVMLLFGSPLAGRQLAEVLRGGSGPASSAALARGYASLPQSFEPNRGQTDPRVDFLSHGRGYSLFLARGGATLLLSRHGNPRAATALRMRLAGARSAVKATGAGRLPGTVNYFRGHDPSSAQTAIPTYRGVVYRGVYRGVDLRYYGSQRRLEYDFSLAPKADPSRIALDFSGARRVDLAAGGDLQLRLPGGVLRERAPVAYQVVAGSRRRVAARYVVRGDRVSFALGAYDRSRPLTIDPVVLAYSTYLGGGSRDSGQGIAVDSTGAAYVTGWTESTDFPTTALDTTQNGDADAFVAKLAPDGKSLVYSTYLGGASQDLGQAIAVDSAGSAYVTGRSLGPGFPTTSGAFDSTVGGIADAFVAKLAPDGQSLAYSTYLGGSDQDNGEAIAVDSAGAAYVTGYADSTDFPITPGAFQTASGGGRDDFVTKLAPDGKTLDYSSYLGGTADEGEHDQRGGVAVDSSGAAYVTGQTSSTDFPIKNAYDAALGGTQDAYVTKFAPDGKSIAYSTYLGGGTYETGAGLAVDSAGSAYVTGLTTSTDFPTQNALDATLRGSSDAFVSKLAPDGKSLAYSTYLGGGSDESGAAIAVDAVGSAYVSGATYSGNFPTTADAFDASLGGGQDAFVSKLAADGASLAYSTYLGGGDVEYGAGVAVDSAGAIYATGTTFSADFPTAGGAFDATLGGSEDAFVSKIADVSSTGVPPPPPVPPAVVSFTKILSGPDGFTSQTPTFTFSSSVAGATFECQFDGEPFEPCTTPLTRYRLKLGPHTFTVRAVTPAGHPDPRPDARVFTLGKTVVTGTPCKALIPRYDGHFMFGRCTVALGECPTGSRCTVSGSVNEYDDDGQGTKFAFVLGSVYLANEQGSFRDGGDCENVRFQGTQAVATNHCMVRTSAVRLGPEADRAVCLGISETSGAEYAGSDDLRYLTCSASMTIEPAAQLLVVVSGANGALIAPSAGALAISAASVGHPRALAAAAKRKPKPLFTPMHIKVKKAGIVKFRFKLSETARSTLARKHKLSLNLKVSFKPTGAKRVTATTQHVTLTHSVLPHCRPHKRVRCR